MKEPKKILVTGAGGQLGTVLKHSAMEADATLDFTFTTSKELDITDLEAVMAFFKNGQYHYCINCAAYTQVDKAEEDGDQALLINEKGAHHLAKAAHGHGTVLLHVSTDFVFDGMQGLPYVETDRAKPLGVYGFSKFKGEQQIVRTTDRYFIIRTSWLYSAHGHNFFKSMLKYGRERDQLSVVFDQVGTPTSANDLADALLAIIASEKEDFGIYHYSNEGVASWYDFASAIFDINGVTVDLRPIRSKDYPLPAERPAFSVLDKEKIKKAFNLQIPHWRESLVRVSHILETMEAETHQP
jgi:dTDP-4-dehydrorhamnose reductase